MNSEAFVYLWFDAKNRMFYLGKRKGHPDDDYTHSSTVMESFTKTDIPPYMHRRILATGTEQEMLDLENKLLENRKRCPRRWDKYYNVVTCFPPPPMYGQDNPNWKGGVSLDIAEYKREYNRKWRGENLEKNREQVRKWREENPEKERARKRKYRQENREKLNEYKRKWSEENAEKKLGYERKWREKNREKIREYDRRYYAKKKAKKAVGNSVDLTQFVG